MCANPEELADLFWYYGTAKDVHTSLLAEAGAVLEQIMDRLGQSED